MGIELCTPILLAYHYLFCAKPGNSIQDITLKSHLKKIILWNAATFGLYSQVTNIYLDELPRFLYQIPVFDTNYNVLYAHHPNSRCKVHKYHWDGAMQREIYTKPSGRTSEK